MRWLRDRLDPTPPSPPPQLNYPPDGTDFKYLLELRAEAEFYGLVGLVTQIDRQVWKPLVMDKIIGSKFARDGV